MSLTANDRHNRKALLAYVELHLQGSGRGGHVCLPYDVLQDLLQELRRNTWRAGRTEGRAIY